MSARHRGLVIVLNLIYAIVLLVLGILPSVGDVAPRIPDNVAHSIAYGVQAVLLTVLFMPAGGIWRGAFVAFAVALVYGGLVEGLQILQPQRTVELSDLMANSIGAAAGAASMIVAAHFFESDAKR
ncbi:MAG: VanZ family protein [Acidobacteria bacterium]|nr:VanZ family protein [Acidobacteriota bacterium]